MALQEAGLHARVGIFLIAPDRDAGVVTSGCLGPTVGCPIAMAFVDRDHAKPGVAVQIDTTRGLIEGQIAALPFYKAAK
ncbi:hypothetical protein J4558_21270 [Leptolyngbya sp. 15MV]|nr:hypothetical protein J4558_21270 [Leptolyngbya sp. 15MV]